MIVPFSEHKNPIVKTTKANIERIMVKTSITKEGDCRHQIDYQLKHWGLQFLEVDPFLCPKCGGKMKIQKFVTDPNEIKATLIALGMITHTRDHPEDNF